MSPGDITFYTLIFWWKKKKEAWSNYPTFSAEYSILMCAIHSGKEEQNKKRGRCMRNSIYWSPTKSKALYIFEIFCLTKSSSACEDPLLSPLKGKDRWALWIDNQYFINKTHAYVHLIPVCLFQVDFLSKRWEEVSIKYRRADEHFAFTCNWVCIIELEPGVT